MSFPKIMLEDITRYQRTHAPVPKSKDPNYRIERIYIHSGLVQKIKNACSKYCSSSVDFSSLLEHASSFFIDNLVYIVNARITSSPEKLAKAIERLYRETLNVQLRVEVLSVEAMEDGFISEDEDED